MLRQPTTPGLLCTILKMMNSSLWVSSLSYFSSVLFLTTFHCWFSGGDAEVLIPSVFIGRTDAEKIIKQYSYPNLDFVLKLTENAPFDINTYLLPFAIVVGICFIIMLGIMVFKCVQDRRRERRHRLPKSSLKKIPTKVRYYGIAETD